MEGIGWDSGRRTGVGRREGLLGSVINACQSQRLESVRHTAVNTVHAGH